MAGSDSLSVWLALRAVQGLDDNLLCRLVQAFGSPEAVRRASASALIEQGGLALSLAAAVQRGPDRETRQAIEQEGRDVRRLGLTVLTILDADYPARLRNIPDPPPLLYVSGELRQDDQQALAIVGSRRMTAAGRVITEELSRDLAAAGFTIVSGLALGVDGAAHRGALEAKGRTVAVLGCGIDRNYPAEHQALRRQIEAHGAVLSELPLGAYPYGYHFPRRNRLISGLSLGVVVTEAALASGSLITARLAAEQGREVFAVPGFVKAETSRGPNSLLKQGAKLVECAEDVIEEVLPQLEPAFRERLRARAAQTGAAPPAMDPRESALYRLLTAGPLHIDQVIARASRPAAEVAGTLLALELKGVVRQLPDQTYIRI